MLCHLGCCCCCCSNLSIRFPPTKLRLYISSLNNCFVPVWNTSTDHYQSQLQTLKSLHQVTLRYWKKVFITSSFLFSIYPGPLIVFHSFSSPDSFSLPGPSMCNGFHTEELFFFFLRAERGINVCQRRQMAVQGVTCQDPAVHRPLHGAMDVTQQRETSPQRNVENETGVGSEDGGRWGAGAQCFSDCCWYPDVSHRQIKWVSGYQLEEIML